MHGAFQYEVDLHLVEINKGFQHGSSQLMRTDLHLVEINKGFQHGFGYLRRRIYT